MLSPEQNFYDRQRSGERWWLLAVVLAVFVHGTVVALAAWLPSFTPAKPPEVVIEISPEGADVLKPTEDTGSAGDKSAQAPQNKKTQPVEKTPPPPQQEERVSEPSEVVQTRQASTIKEPPPPPPPAETITAPPPPPPETSTPAPTETPKEPVSLAPTSVKIKKPVDNSALIEKRIKELEQEKAAAKAKAAAQKKADAQKREEERIIKERLDAIKQSAEEKRKREREEWELKERRRKEADETKRLAAQQRKMEEDAQRAADEARRAREELQRLQNAANSGSGSSSGSGSNQAANSATVQNYGDRVEARLRSFWILPEARQWNPNLSAKVSLTVNSDGQVAKIVFDQSSGDPNFDELVRRTIIKSSPMPVFPTVLRQPSVTIGFNFTPGNLGNR